MCSIVWRTISVTPTSVPTGVRSLAARGTSAPEAKVLTTGPPMVPGLGQGFAPQYPLSILFPDDDGSCTAYLVPIQILSCGQFVLFSFPIV